MQSRMRQWLMIPIVSLVLWISMVTLFPSSLFNMYGKKIIGVIPILLGLIVGYIFSVVLGWLTGHEFVQFSKVAAAHWFQVPSFDIPFVNYDFKLYPSAILTMAPIAFVTMTEHFGHVMVLNSLTGRDYFKDPGLDRTLTGDGLAQIIAGFFGAPPVTSYGENIGVMALSKVYSVYVIAGAAVIAVLMSFIGKVSALLSSIPTAVLGGISIALFGVIAASGLKILVEHKIDFDNKKNLLIASVILVSGIGGLMIDLGGFKSRVWQAQPFLEYCFTKSCQILIKVARTNQSLKRKNYGDCRWESVTKTFGDYGNPHE